MSLQRINISQPCDMRGLEQEFPDELQESVLELIRRSETNRQALVRDLRSQVVVDTSILPTETLGEDQKSTATVMVSTDADDLAKESLMIFTYG